MSYDQLVGLAVEIAVESHKGQTDKSGRPYIQHPLRVANGFRKPELKIIALLHDVIEDTDYPLDDIYLHFGEEVGDAVKAITKVKGEELQSYLNRVKGNDLARKVKLQDIEDNMSVYRLILLPVDKALKMVQKYHYCYNYLK